MNPRIPITDPKFKYTDSASTDLRKLFAKVRKEQVQAIAAAVERAIKVTPIKRQA